MKGKKIDFEERLSGAMSERNMPPRYDRKELRERDIIKTRNLMVDSEMEGMK